MKRLIIIATAIFLSVALFAQDAHLKFKGIPLDGSYNAFAKKLTEKGFILQKATDDRIELTGSFMAYPNALVMVYPDPSTKVVAKVSALIETKTDGGYSWTITENTFRSIVNTYKEKYGKPVEYSETFIKEEPGSDYARINSLLLGECDYRSVWVMDGGRIEITLLSYRQNIYVVCTYIDEQNIKALHQTILNDI